MTSHLRAIRGVTCPMGSHSVACHPTQVNSPRLTPAKQAGTRFTYPAGLSRPRWLVTYRDGLPARRRSPIQVL